jgi:hypothetical protein
MSAFLSAPDGGKRPWGPVEISFHCNIIPAAMGFYAIIIIAILGKDKWNLGGSREFFL